jgi:type IV secretory pathway TrbD component
MDQFPLKRDHIIVVIAMLFVSAGLADGLYRGFGVPLWAAVPFGVAVWSGAAVLMYRQSQKERALANEEASGGA